MSEDVIGERARLRIALATTREAIIGLRRQFGDDQAAKPIAEFRRQEAEILAKLKALGVEDA